MIRINFDHGPQLSLCLLKSESPGSPQSPQRYCELSEGSSRAAEGRRSWEEQSEDSDEVLTSEIRLSQSFRLRKCQEINQILKQFSRTINSHPRPPKLENLRYRVMRSLKKFIRRLLEEKSVSKKGILAISGQLDQKLMHTIQEYCKVHRSALADFAVLKNGPCVDHRRSGRKTGHNTYNNSYMREIFREREVREAYSLYVQLLFSRDQPEGLCKRFKVECCGESSHGDECGRKWGEFRKVLVEFLGAEVDGGEES